MDQIITITLCLIVSAFPVPTQGDEKANPLRPNILILMSDQLNADVLSCYGGPVQTPHIDRLAREGVRFAQACCPTPVCSPSRASIVTGMYPHAHGIVVNVSDNPSGGQHKPDGITPSDVTTERLLSEDGYATHHYGKWHLCGEALPYYPDMYHQHPEYTDEMKNVFDEVRQTDPAGWMRWYTHAYPVDIDAVFRQAAARVADRWKDAPFADFILKIGRLKLPLDKVFDVRVADLTEECIREVKKQNKPFMITCSFNLPHDPNVVPSPYYEMYDPQRIKLPDNWQDHEPHFEREWSRQIVANLGESGLREFLRVYFASVKLIDDQVGRILKTLDQLGITDDTIILFAADHGDMAGGHGMVWKSTTAFYDEIVRVPLLIRYPRRLPVQQYDSPVDLVDVMPTLMDLIGKSVPEKVQGVSVVPFLVGKADRSQARQYSFCERIPAHPKGLRQIEPGTQGCFMVRGQGWKYIRYPNGLEYLYDLKNDPGETRNLAGRLEHKTQRDRLSGNLNQWLARTGWPER